MDDVASVEVVELQVPGLGPVDRDRLLTRATEVRRESGDDKAGLYRTRLVDLDKRLGTHHEVYDWTRLTIGGASRALWLFLMPFLLVNMVDWMQPYRPVRSDGRLRRVAGGLYEFGARLLALSFTVLVVGAFGELALDQFAWQCAPAARGVCDPGNPAVRLLRGWDESGAGVGLVVAAVVPFLVVFVLLFMARDTKQEYLPVLKTVTEETANRAVREQHLTHKENLELEGFWEYNRRDPGMAAQHVWAGLLTTAGLLTWTPLAQDLRGNGGPTRAGVLLFAVIVVMALLTVASVPRLYRVELSRPAVLLSRWARRPLPWLSRRAAASKPLPLWPTRYPKLALTGCVAVNVAAVLYCLVPDRRWSTGAELPGIQVQSTVVLLVQALCVFILAAASAVLPRRGTRRHMALYGAAGPAMAVVACFVAWLYTTGFALWTGAWLARDGQRPDVPKPVDVMGMALPPVLLLGTLCWAVTRAGLWFTFLARGERSARPPSRRGPVRLARDFLAAVRDREEQTDDRRYVGELRAARRRHEYLLRELDWNLGALAVLIALTAGSFYVRPVHASGLRDAWDLTARLLETVSLPLFAGLAGLMLLTFRTLAIRSEMRQNAGLAWAFGAFWPRAVHPFAPPSWTVRAVPELVHRLRVLLDRDDRRVLIRAASMGSVLALAAIWQLEPERRARIALLTTGCPAVYFSRTYPAFVCRRSLADLAPGGPAGLAAWTNVWRDTDPLAGPVQVPGVDLCWSERNVIPPTPLRTPGQPVFPPIEGHRGYTSDDRLLALRDTLLRALRTP